MVTLLMETDKLVMVTGNITHGNMLMETDKLVMVTGNITNGNIAHGNW